jgi:hypothetical protein
MARITRTSLRAPSRTETQKSDRSRFDEIIIEVVGGTALGTLNHGLEPRFRDAVQHACTPFDHNDRVSEVDVEVIQLKRRSEAIGVNVDERRTVDDAGMRSCENKRRAGHGATNPEALTDASGERCFASSQRTGQHQDVARAKVTTKLLAERIHLIRGADGSHALGQRI